MEKSPEAFRTIREVAEAMQLPQHVLRFWETRFPQVRPLKRAGGRRYYRPDDVERLRLIKRLLYDEGYTIKGVQKLFKEQGVQNLAAGAFEAPSPFEPAGTAPAGDAKDSSRLAADGGGSAPEPAAWKDPSAATAASIAADELATLRRALAEIQEAQQILRQAGPRQE